MKKIVSIMLVAVMLSLVPGVGMLGGMAAFAFEIAPVGDVVYDTVYETVYEVVYDVVEDVVYETEEDNLSEVFTLSIGQNTASVFGEVKESDVQPIIRNDRTMLPARFVAENLGAEVSWDGETRTVLIKSEAVEIKLTIDSAVAVVNGLEEMLDSPAFIENDRTYTPVRFIAEKLGSTVNWNPATQTVIMSKPVYVPAEIPADETNEPIGTMQINNFRYEYEADGHITEINEGSVGGMHLTAEVAGPDNVNEVLIAAWKDEPYSQEEIQSQIEFMVNIWKREGIAGGGMWEVPFEFNGTHPVDAEELGKKMYVLLIGLDANGDAAAYAVVEEIIG